MGLSAAIGLARQGVQSVLLEQKPGTSRYSRAPCIHLRTREIFRLWGVEQRLLAAGTLVQTLTVHNVVPERRPLISVGSTELAPEADRPGILILEQGETERLLLEALQQSGMCDVRFGAEAVGLVPGEGGTRLAVDQDGAEHWLDAQFVVGCDGAKSFVRDALGLPFEGITYWLRPMLADVRLADERDALAWPRLNSSTGQLAFAVRLRPGLWRIVRLERQRPSGGCHWFAW